MSFLRYTTYFASTLREAGAEVGETLWLNSVFLQKLIQKPSKKAKNFFDEINNLYICFAGCTLKTIHF